MLYFLFNKSTNNFIKYLFKCHLGFMETHDETKLIFPSFHTPDLGINSTKLRALRTLQESELWLYALQLVMSATALLLEGHKLGSRVKGEVCYNFRPHYQTRLQLQYGTQRKRASLGRSRSRKWTNLMQVRAYEQFPPTPALRSPRNTLWWFAVPQDASKMVAQESPPLERERCKVL